MDEPKQSPARASGFMIPLGLALMLIAYVWPVEAGEVTFSRLLGFRGAGLPRTVVPSLIFNSAVFVVGIASFRRATPWGRAFVYGLAALLGLQEMLFAVAMVAFAEVLPASLGLSAVAGLLLVIAALGAMDRIRTAEIRKSEGGRT